MTRTIERNDRPQLVEDTHARRLDAEHLEHLEGVVRHGAGEVDLLDGEDALQVGALGVEVPDVLVDLVERTLEHIPNGCISTSECALEKLTPANTIVFLRNWDLRHRDF